MYLLLIGFAYLAYWSSSGNAFSFQNDSLPSSQIYILKLRQYHSFGQLRDIWYSIESSLLLPTTLDTYHPSNIYANGTTENMPILELVERPLPDAAQHMKTDFLLLKINHNSIKMLNYILDELQDSHHVRSVFADSKLQRVPLADPNSKPLRQTRSFSFSPFRPPAMAREQTKIMDHVRQLWNKGCAGQNVRIGVFDTGLTVRRGDRRFKHLRDITNWTSDPSLDDKVGHGSLVAGIIAANNQSHFQFCPGIAPDSELYIFRVFTNKQFSQTSWFLDAFNYALHIKLDIVNLSIGGPDYEDAPFYEKVWELTANNIIVISAIGNDGPTFGSLNNPGDLISVIGVGSIDNHENISPFSSRGMTLHELPEGFGRAKPDVVVIGEDVVGLGGQEVCETTTGTSFSSPLLTGISSLLVSLMRQYGKGHYVNPASMKQAYIASAKKLQDSSIFEQGAGSINLAEAADYFLHYEPVVSAHPDKLDLTSCPYFWPYCAQPIYYSAFPVIVNITILNGIDVSGTIVNVRWLPSATHSTILKVSFHYEPLVWPWSGAFAAYFEILPEGHTFDGIAEGLVEVTVNSLQESRQILMPVRVRVIPTPPSNRRILWDQYHSINYPIHYVPRDSLDHRIPIDVFGDHPYTNFAELFNYLRTIGYFVEILNEPWTCFDATNYGALLLVDLEDDFAPDELAKITHDVNENSLNLLVFAEWFDPRILERLRFFDAGTERWWEPITGGANLPSLNRLLNVFGMAFGTGVYSGRVDFSEMYQVALRSASSLVQLPSGAYRVKASGLTNDYKRFYSDERPDVTSNFIENDVPILAYLSTGPKSGRIAAFGDTGCFDSSQKWKYDLTEPVTEEMYVYDTESAHLPDVEDKEMLMCMWLVKALLDYSVSGTMPEMIHSKAEVVGENGFMDTRLALPKFAKDRVDFELVSRTAKRVQKLKNNDTSSFMCTRSKSDPEQLRKWWSEGIAKWPISFELDTAQISAYEQNPVYYEKLMSRLPYIPFDTIKSPSNERKFDFIRPITIALSCILLLVLIRRPHVFGRSPTLWRRPIKDA